MKVSRVNIFGMSESITASKYPMSIDIDSLDDEITNRVDSLGKSKQGTGHPQFLCGIIVQFDLTFTNKAWVEAERYHWLDFVSSQSTMHKISKMDIKEQCNEYVTENSIMETERLKEIYLKDKTEENYLRLLYNIPSGFQLTARMTTNYLQFKTIYSQRKAHKLPEWRELCEWMKTLPNSSWITGE